MPAPSAARALIGRDQPLSELLAAFGDAAAGQPGVVVLAGDAGMGKTTLVESFLDRVSAITLVGNCVPVMSRAMPFVPVIQALRELGRSLDPQSREQLIRRVPSVFARLMPEPDDIPGRPSQNHPGGTAARPVTGDDLASGAGQVRLFGQFLDLLVSLPKVTASSRSGQAVVFVVEDVHWADRSTLDLIGYLARNLVGAPVLLLLTVRSDDLSREHPVRGWLAELQRLPLTRRVQLDPLTRTDTAMQLMALLDRPPDDHLVDVVHQHSAGNPMFAEQLLPWALEPHRALPENLHDLVAARFADLPDGTLRALEVAAVLGRVVDLRVLAAVLDVDEETVEQAVAGAVDRLVLSAGPGDGYTFKHPLFREVLVGDLMPGQRRRLHERAARVLQEQPSTDPGTIYVRIGHIARHWEAADAPDLAFVAAVRAGLAAQDVYAFPEADEYLNRAVRLSETLPDTAFEGLPVDQVGLLARAAQVGHIVGDQLRAVELSRRAVELGRSTDVASNRLAALLERHGLYCYFAGVPESDTAYREALALLPETRPSAERARVLAYLAMLALGWSRLDEAKDWATSALDLAQAVGARREEGLALNTLGLTSCYDGDIERGLQLLHESLAIAEETGEPDDLASAHISLSHMLGEVGRYEEAAQVGRAGHEQMRRLGLVRQEGSFLQANAAIGLLKAGHWDDAEEVLATAQAQHPRGMLAFPILVVSSRVAVARGDLDRARRLVAQIEGITRRHELPDSWLRELDELGAELALWQHDGATALEIIDRALGRAQASDEQLFGAQLVWLQARTLADLADRARVGQDVETATGMQERGRRLADREAALAPVAVAFPESVATGMTTRAELLRLAGDHTVDPWTRAAEAWAALGRGPMLVYTRWREAEASVLGKVGGEPTVTAVRRAYALARDQRAQLVLGEVVALARWGRVDLGPGVAQDVAAPVEAPALDIALTPREREVLAALVAGHSNGQIAADMFISVKTASVHVSNILRKLGVSGREEAARLAYRMNLTDPPG